MRLPLPTVNVSLHVPKLPSVESASWRIKGSTPIWRGVSRSRASPNRVRHAPCVGGVGRSFSHLSPCRPDLGCKEVSVARRFGEEHHVIDREAVDDALQRSPRLSRAADRRKCPRSPGACRGMPLEIRGIGN